MGLPAVPTIEMNLVQQVERCPFCEQHIIRWLAKRLLWFSTQPPKALGDVYDPCGHSDDSVSERCRLNALSHVATTHVLDARQNTLRSRQEIQGQQINLAVIVVRSKAKHESHEYPRRPHTTPNMPCRRENKHVATTPPGAYRTESRYVETTVSLCSNGV